MQVCELMNEIKCWLPSPSLCHATWTVENLLSVAVKNYAEIEKRIAQGTKNRTLASTNMNATSRCENEHHV